MKRILSACLEQTHKFETEEDYETFIRGLERKRIKYIIVNKEIRSDRSIYVKLKRGYNSYPTGDYLNDTDLIFRK